jgi:NitT/TauT family transport system permease protein
MKELSVPKQRPLHIPAFMSSLWVKRVILLILILIIWETLSGGFGSALQMFKPVILPPPSKVVVALLDYATSGLMTRDLTFTLSGTILALVLGILIGSFVGLLLGYLPAIAEVLEPIMVGLNSMPRVALAPIIIVWFGLGLPSKAFLGLFTVFFVIFFNTFFGVRSVDPELVKAVRAMGATSTQIIRLVIIPSVLTWIFAALRSSVSYALSGVVVGEFVGSSRGLGYRMAIAAGVLDTARVFAILLVIGLVSSILITIASRVERHLLRWRPASLRLGS